jgi:predicted amidohydrolase
VLKRVKIALLHIEPHLGNLDHNRRKVERAINLAASRGANWIITPEMCISGYFFYETIGTDWIETQPDDWLLKVIKLAREKQLTIFLSYPQKNKQNGKLYNSLFVLTSKGGIGGIHDKIEVHPGPEEEWSTPGVKLEPVEVDEISIGLLVCADITKLEYLHTLKNKGTELFVCSMAWGHKYSPGDMWEKRTAEVGAPVFVCNRTGREKMVDWTKADSVVAKDGKRLLQWRSEKPAILLFDWNLKNMKLISQDFEALYLEN